MIFSEVTLRTTESSTPHFLGSETQLVFGAARTDAEKEAKEKKTEAKSILVVDYRRMKAGDDVSVETRAEVMVGRDGTEREGAFCRTNRQSVLSL
jgi:hypothetical protein